MEEDGLLDVEEGDLIEDVPPPRKATTPPPLPTFSRPPSRAPEEREFATAPRHSPSVPPPPDQKFMAKMQYILSHVAAKEGLSTDLVSAANALLMECEIPSPDDRRGVILLILKFFTKTLKKPYAEAPTLNDDDLWSLLFKEMALVPYLEQKIEHIQRRYKRDKASRSVKL